MMTKELPKDAVLKGRGFSRVCHGFSRAASGIESTSALAAEGCLSGNSFIVPLIPRPGLWISFQKLLRRFSETRAQLSQQQSTLQSTPSVFQKMGSLESAGIAIADIR
jgi:hypothetical protein